MAEHAGEETSSARETLVEEIAEKLHGHDQPHGDDDDDDSSSSDSDAGRSRPSDPPAKKPNNAYRPFGRENPVHTILGGGKPADVFLWRDKKISAGVLGVGTTIWVLFEVLEYHLLTLVAHGLIFSLAILFLWSNASAFINKTKPRIPEVNIPEDVAVNIALSLRYEVNRAFAVLREITSGRDLKKFLIVIAGLWILSVIGSQCNFLTLAYIVFVILHTVPVLYEKYEDKVDLYAEKAMVEIKKQYAVFDAKVLSKIPRGPSKDKKH